MYVPCREKVVVGRSKLKTLSVGLAAGDPTDTRGNDMLLVSPLHFADCSCEILPSRHACYQCRHASQGLLFRLQFLIRNFDLLEAEQLLGDGARTVCPDSSMIGLIRAFPYPTGQGAAQYGD